MKIKLTPKRKTTAQPVKPTKARPEAKVAGSYTHTALKFSELTPADFEMLKRKGMAHRFPTAQRSYLCRHAKKLGWDYRTIPIKGTDESWVLRL